MIRACATALVIAALAGSPAVAPSESERHLRRFPLPGPPLATATACASGGCVLYLLVLDPRAAGDTRVLVRFDGSALTEIEAGLDPWTSGVVVLDTDQDGEPEPLLVRDGALWRPGQPDLAALDRPLLTVAGADFEAVARLHVAGDARLPVPRPGELVLFRLERGSASVLCRAAMPLGARRGRNVLHLSGPPVHRVGDDPAFLVVGPEERGAGRWRTLLLRASGDERCFDVVETWQRLAEPERAIAADVVLLGDQPSLLVATLRSGRVGIFERRKVRLLPLRPDRTPRGIAPVFAEHSNSRMWQDLATFVRDVDGDGAADVLLLEREGFSGDQVVVDVWHGGASPPRKTPGGMPGFAARPVQMTLRERVGSESLWHWGDDITGDGRADLVIAAGELLVWPGLANGVANGGRRPLAAEPSVRLALADRAARDDLRQEARDGWPVGGQLLVFDLDRAPPAEVVLVRRTGEAGAAGELIVLTTP